MKTLSTTAVLALATTALGLAVALPASAQEAAPTPRPGIERPQADMPDRQGGKGGMNDHGPRAGGPGERGPHGGPGEMGPRRGGGMGMLDLARGSEAVEIAMVRLGHRLDLTAEQQPLFDAFRTAAIEAATDFETALEGLRPMAPMAPMAAPDATAPDAAAPDATATPPAPAADAAAPEAPDVTAPAMPSIATLLDDRIAIARAELAALEKVQPSAKAFFESLTEEQLAQLRPERGGPGGPRDGQWGPRHGGPDADNMQPPAPPADGMAPPAPPADGMAPPAPPADGTEPPAPPADGAVPTPPADGTAPAAPGNTAI